MAAFAGGQVSGKSAHEVSYSESDESLHISGVRIYKVSEVKPRFPLVRHRLRSLSAVRIGNPLISWERRILTELL
jgi:hypothetical protein